MPGTPPASPGRPTRPSSSTPTRTTPDTVLDNPEREGVTMPVVPGAVDDEADAVENDNDWIPGRRLFPWSSSLVHDNCTFDLDPGHCYDEVPDVKAYLAVLGSTKPLNPNEPAIPWYWRPPESTQPLTERDREMKGRCEAAVRRGVLQLMASRERARGARRYSLWDPYPWIPFSSFAEVRPGYEGEFHSNCLPRWDLGDGTELRLSKDMIQGNIRLPLAGDGRSDLARLSPESPLWPLYIAELYHVSAHPTALMVLTDCNRYDELKDCTGYGEAIREDVDTMRQISYESVPTIEILEAMEVR
ncbi:hypothetical protein A1Q1_03641 [Trichosporon asahii var. asahii CBS 2479]|uniref:Uncharacterized protein n=1 Tax=Trichosporon asahii var. asahii (strain ATCC 90039 / CBS 2479 / JCM 2466 / KCTC 7840 / NBRC 103889/ NCYC 2677 / UAMH 7654) TaxID=1186058 RepID=J6ESM5_TRIAS|nr:hypothetical protein A1Q1_03641 [Trichosporon asahii var. asahii CBS 2479]EJT47529.1 hypothetical protein A1Q1_03641 [Trichosporon asahii var. asahii CBS 2479]